MTTDIKKALEDLKQGKLIVVLDDLDRENEGDLLALGEFVTPEAINFMITHGKGLLCAPVSEKVANLHSLKLAPSHNSDGTNFTLSIDGTKSTTGISAFERFDTLKEMMSGKAVEFKTPGHLFPLIARNGGLSVRRGHTEATVDLAKLVKTKEVGLIVEIIKEDGTMMRRDDLLEFCKKHDLTFITIDDLVKYIEANDKNIWNIEKDEDLFDFSNEATLPTKNGDLKIKSVIHKKDSFEMVLIYKDKINLNNPLVRIHSECLTSESFGSLKCDCKLQLDSALEQIANEDGIIIYTKDEGRGIGLFNKINAYHLQDKGLDTVEANEKLGFKPEERSFDYPALLLEKLKIDKVRLLTNNPLKVSVLEKHGIKVDRVEHIFKSNEHAKEYLKTKKAKMGHEL